MTTLHAKPISELGKRLQTARIDRPNEWQIDEYTRMAESTYIELKGAQDRVQELRAENVELLNIVNQFVDCKFPVFDTWGIGYSAFDEAYKRALKLRGE